jgi:hypothetical protein
VTVSYFEWVRDRQGFFWNEGLVNERLREFMDESFDSVLQYAEAHQVHNRTAAYMLALDRVANAIRLRGIYAGGGSPAPSPRARRLRKAGSVPPLPQWGPPARPDSAAADRAVHATRPLGSLSALVFRSGSHDMARRSQVRGGHRPD